MKKIMFLALAFLFLASACRKDSTIIDTTIVYPAGAVLVKSSIGGVVRNESGQPVVGATVQLLENTKVTDNNGVFYFKDVTVNSLNAFIKVSHPRYFHGSRTVMVSADTRNTVDIQLLSNRPTEFVNAVSGGQASFAEGHSLTLPAGGIVTKSGQPYTGEVGVAAKWLNPVGEHFGAQMPGRLEGFRTDGELSGMVSMGMLAVELTDASGNKLQVRDGYQAEIKVKVPQELLPSAPPTIPLWYFDEDKGWWREEGQASLQNGFYVGQVSHFSYWNYDYYAPSVTVKFLATWTNGDPVEGAHIMVSLSNGNVVAHGYTDENGCITGQVPKDETLTAKVFLPSTPDCPTSIPLLVQQIGPFGQDGTVQLELLNPATNYYHITGTLSDCGGLPVTEGYVYVQQTGSVAWVDSEGHFSIEVSTCQVLNTVTLSGVDLATMKGTGLLTFNVVQGENPIGVLSVCDDLQQFFTFEYDGNSYTYTYELEVVSWTDSTGVVWRQLGRRHPAFEGYFLNITVVDVTGPGTYISPLFLLDGIEDGQLLAHSSNDEVTVNITEFDGPGSIIGGTYYGTAYIYNPDSTIIPPVITVSGAFRIQQ